MAKKRITEVQRNGTDADFVATNYMLIDGAEGSTKMRMNLFGKASAIEELDEVKYEKPEGGIPKGDLSVGVQDSLDLADSALQTADLEGKADKVTAATNGDLAGLDSTGNLTDSGYKPSDFVTAQALADEVTARENADDALDARLASAESDIGNLESSVDSMYNSGVTGTSDEIDVSSSTAGKVKTFVVSLANAMKTKINAAYDHISDSVKHITDTERTNWNAAYSHSRTEGNPHGTTIEEINGLRSELTEIESDVTAIEELIPSEATPSNQLADKAFVNSSVTSNTATFRGTSAAGLTEEQFLAWADALTKSNNDYVFWNTTDTSGNILFKRYKYNGSSWAYEFSLNNSSFTSVQWAAINSGITETDVDDIGYNTAVRHSHSNKSVLDNTTASFTTADETKLDGIEAGAQVNLPVDNALSASSTNPVQNKVVKLALDAKQDKLDSADVVWDYQNSDNRPSFSEIRQTLRTNKRIYVKNMGMVIGYYDSNNRDTPDDECYGDLYFYVMELGDTGGFNVPDINVIATNCTEIGQYYRVFPYELKQTQKIKFAQGYNGTSISDVQRVVGGNDGATYGSQTHNCAPIFLCDLSSGNSRKAIPAIDYKSWRDEHYGQHAYITVYDDEIKSRVTYKWDQPDGGIETRTKEVNRIQEVIPEIPSNITSDYYQEVQSKLSAASANNTPLFADIGHIVPVSWFGYGSGTSTGESGSNLGFSYFDPYEGQSQMTTIRMDLNSSTDEVTYSKEEKKLKETIRYTWPADNTMTAEQYEELKKIVRKVNEENADLVIVDEDDYAYPAQGAWYNTYEDYDVDEEEIGIYTFPDGDSFFFFNAYKYDSETTIYNSMGYETAERVWWTNYRTESDGYMPIGRESENFLIVLSDGTKTSLKFRVFASRIQIKYKLTNDVDADNFSILDRHGNEMLMDVSAPALPIYSGYTYIIDIADGCYSVKGFGARTDVSSQLSLRNES